MRRRSAPPVMTTEDYLRARDAKKGDPLGIVGSHPCPPSAKHAGPRDIESRQAFPASSTSSRSPPARAASANPPPPAISRSASPRIGLKAGILDADIYGPSQPKLFGLRGKPRQIGPRMLEPMERFGVKVMSIGFLVEEDLAMIWRGADGDLGDHPDAARGGVGRSRYSGRRPAARHGDAQLTMAQQAPLAGAVIVSTPQDIALDRCAARHRDVREGEHPAARV